MRRKKRRKRGRRRKRMKGGQEGGGEWGKVCQRAVWDLNCRFLLADQADFIKVHFALSQPHLGKSCQGGGELSDTGPTGKSLSFPTPCLQVPVYLTVPRVTSDGRQMALRSCWVNNISHHGCEVQPDHCYSKTVNEARCW